jgi:hypothetical protein
MANGEGTASSLLGTAPRNVSTWSVAASSLKIGSTPPSIMRCHSTTPEVRRMAALNAVGGDAGRLAAAKTAIIPAVAKTC